MNSNLRIALIAIVTSIAALAAYISINSYLEKRHQITHQRQEIQRSVAENTAAANELLTFEINPGSVTYGELFERGG